MPARRSPVGALRALLGADTAGVRQSLVALGLNSSTSFVAGLTLASISATLEEFPGLLVLVPAAVGLRGNIFGSFGNRLSTTIHAGTFRLTLRRESVLGQNVLAAAALTAGASLALAVMAKALSVSLGIENSIGLLDLATVSVVGGIVGSLPVLAGSLGLTAGAVRRGWDLDNVTAPLVSTLGDVLTLPALWLATFLLGYHLFTPTVGLMLSVGAVAVVVLALRSNLDLLRRIVRESLPILIVAGFLSAMAGIVLAKQLDSFLRYPALLIMEPAHLSSAGALGGILAGRLSTRFLLGLAEPTAWPTRAVRREIYFVVGLAVPVFLFNAVGAHYIGLATDHASPGFGPMIAASLVGGALAMVVVVALAYYGTIVAVRAGLDPDNYGIPLVSSSVDFVGAFGLILAISALGIV